MADKVFLGGATSVAQVDTFTPATVTTSDVNTLTYTDEAGATTAINFTIGGTQTAAAASAGLIAAWAANAITAAVATASGTSTVVLTAVTPGRPFIVASSVTGTGTLTRAATTANVGSADWGTAANWSTGAVPANSDNVYLNGRSANAITYGLNQSAVTLAALYIEESMAWAVGTLIAKLRIGATKHDIGKSPTGGTTTSMTSLVNLDFGSVQTTGTIHGSRNVGTSGQAPIQIKGTHASNAITVKGSAIVGFGTNTAGEAATVLTLTVKDQTKVEVGSGVTLATLNPEGGETLLNCAVTTIAYGEGTVRTEGTGTVTTAIIGGHFIGNSTGTITNITAAEKGFADLTQNTAARTVTNGFISGLRARFSTDNGVPLSVTVTNGVDLLNGAKSTQVNYGDGVTVSQSAI